MLEGHVVRSAEPDVFVEFDQPHVREAIADEGGTSVARGVVDHDRVQGDSGLRLDALETALQQVAGVVADDDDVDTAVARGIRLDAEDRFDLSCARVPGRLCDSRTSRGFARSAGLRHRELGFGDKLLSRRRDSDVLLQVRRVANGRDDDGSTRRQVFVELQAIQTLRERRDVVREQAHIQRCHVAAHLRMGTNAEVVDVGRAEKSLGVSC